MPGEDRGFQLLVPVSGRLDEDGVLDGLFLRPFPMVEGGHGGQNVGAGRKSQLHDLARQIESGLGVG